MASGRAKIIRSIRYVIALLQGIFHSYCDCEFGTIHSRRYFGSSRSLTNLGPLWAALGCSSLARKSHNLEVVGSNSRNQSRNDASVSAPEDSAADFDSPMRRFESSRPSQKSSRKNNQLGCELRRILSDSRSRHVPKIFVCFQGLPIFAGGSTRYRRNMKWEKSSPFNARKFVWHHSFAPGFRVSPYCTRLRPRCSAR
jgi:hypothetical protein